MTVRAVVPAPARRLGLVRLLVGGYTLWYVHRHRTTLRELAASDPALFEPVGPVHVLHKPLPAPVARKLIDATLASTVLFTLGVKHKLVGPVHSALLAWILSYKNSWSMVHHSENMLVWHTMLLSASRAADAASVDALLAGPAPAAPHPRYGWPLQAMRAASSVVYLLSGIAKLAGGSGWGWVNGGAMRRQVAIDRIRKDVFGSSRGIKAAQLLYPYRHLFTGFAVVSLILELGAPLGLLNRKLGRLWAVAAFGMHWGIRVIMGIRFRYQLSGASFAAWFDLDRLPCLRGRSR
jgi:hypothetical protein